MSQMIKVVIADDHAILREGLKQILAETDDIQVIADAKNAGEAIKLAATKGLDVLVLDISLPDRSGIEACKIIKRDFPRVSILMLSMHREDAYAIRALRSGASGYLSKQSASDSLVTAIRTVAKGKKYISEEVAYALAEQVGGDVDKPLHECLSNREFQTLTMIASGLAVSDIAQNLSLSVKTVSMYRARLLEKLNLRHNAELTHYAIKNNLVD
ncbi:response regulator transcription factor [Methylobacillus caricis]|uniref:response regulator n=1 Tax=Methylobacillus caricis TaxID=1971611 RepID=UPI001CFF68E2|nr:response regulator transcription factor [Methylobacillus caricis]MCB5188018.1 response regulator transcription factor [Methylobacillus caricis]